MRANLFWFNDEQWAKIEPLLPTRQPDPKPKNDRRILSGIMHVLKVGCRWQDCPPEYGPHKTIYNRFNRWSGRGIWQGIFETVAGSPEPCTSNCSESCASVRSPLRAASVTFVLKSSVRFRCGVFLWSLPIRGHQRARCRAENPLIGLSKIPEPAYIFAAPDKA
jgi:transposase